MDQSLTDARQTGDAPTSRPPEPGPLSYPCGPAPATGLAETREIVAGVHWVRLGLPFKLDHINCWLLADDDAHGPRWTVVDTGVGGPASIAQWQGLLAAGGPLDPDAEGAARLSRVVVTHMHPDHVGMAGWLTETHGVPLWMSALEYFTARTLMMDKGPEPPAEGLAFYRACGWGDVALARYRQRFGFFGRHIQPIPQAYQRLVDGQMLTIGRQRWQVVTGHGHSPEHACLACDEAGLFIAGDQLLPTISSNVSVHPTEPEADPLGGWLASLDKLDARLDDRSLVLPAHGEPFRQANRRIQRLRLGHQRALERLDAALRERPRRVVDTFPQLFGREFPEDSDVLMLATGEALAHLHRLRAQSLSRREFDAHGVAWWSSN